LSRARSSAMRCFAEPGPPRRLVSVTAPALRSAFHAAPRPGRGCAPEVSFSDATGLFSRPISFRKRFACPHAMMLTHAISKRGGCGRTRTDGSGRTGYDDHHIVEQTWAEYFGFSRSQIDDPSNLVSIPRLKHYQITGWYGAPNPDYGWLSPREYLSDKSWDERMKVGRDALILFGALKP